MTRLRDLARLIRSKNAGIFDLTLDIMFAEPAVYQRVARSGVLSKPHIAELFQVDPDVVELYFYDPANAIKISFPRAVACGDPADGDIFGGQQFGPLLNLDIPEPDEAAVRA